MKIFRALKQNDGAAMVEFAIVLPLFMVLTFGIIEFGIIMYNKAMITNASREGARLGILFFDPQKSVGDLQSDVIGKVADKLGADPDNLNDSMLISLGGPATLVITPDWATGDEYLEVKVEYPYQFLLPKLFPGVPDIMNIVATTTMRMEYQAP